MSKPVFILTVCDDGEVLISNHLRDLPISELVALLREIADGFERGDARRVR